MTWAGLLPWGSTGIVQGGCRECAGWAMGWMRVGCEVGADGGAQGVFRLMRTFISSARRHPAITRAGAGAGAACRITWHRGSDAATTAERRSGSGGVAVVEPK